MKLSYNAPIPNTFGLAVRAACLLEYDSAAELQALLSDARFASELPLPLFQMGQTLNDLPSYLPSTIFLEAVLTKPW